MQFGRHPIEFTRRLHDSTASAPGLLAPDEPAAWEVERPSGASPWLLLCDHAGRRIPRRLGTLGLDQADLRRHIAWDIGAAEVTRRLSTLLDATAVLQPYSRLVIDCTRPPGSADSIVTLSERTPIPGNAALGREDVLQREAAIFQPYHAQIRALLDARQARAQPCWLIAMHSFTPVYLDEARRWHAGLLYHRDARMAHALRDLLRREPGLVIGDNEPYSVSDDTDVAIPEYGEKRGLPHVELEIRQDLIDSEAGQQQWAERLARMLRMMQHTPTWL